MAKYIYVTDDIANWFLPLLPASEQKALAENPQVYAIGAVEDSTACGIMVVLETELMTQIRYIVVADDYRRQGIGTGLVQYLSRALYEDAPILTCPFAASGKDDPIYQMFQYMWNFSILEEEGYYCRVPLASLKENKTLSSMKGKGRRAVPFFSLTEREQRSFRNHLLEQNVPYLQSIDEKDCVKDLCLCCKTDSGSISTAVFVTQENGTDDLELSCVWAAAGSQMDLMGLFYQACSQASDRETGYLNIAAVSETSVSMVEKIFPEREITKKFYEAVWSMDL